MSDQEQEPYSPEVQPFPAEPSGPPPAPAVRILVVEDDLLTRKAVGRKLQNAGFEVIMIPTAGDALILANRLTFQVLVLDLNLPDDTDPFASIQDGFPLLDWLRRQLGELRFKTVIHTSQASQHILEKAQEYGVFAVCRKQRDLNPLLAYVTAAVQALQAATSEENSDPGTASAA